MPPDTQGSLPRLWEMSWENTSTNLLWFICLRQASRAECKGKSFNPPLSPALKGQHSAPFRRGFTAGLGKQRVLDRNLALTEPTYKPSH